MSDFVREYEMQMVTCGLNEIKSVYRTWKKSHDQSEQHNKKQRRYLRNKGPSENQNYGFPVIMYGCEIGL